MELHWPQIAYIVLHALGLGITAAKNGQQSTYEFGTSIVSSLIVFALLYFGGFFTGGR